MQSNEMVGRLAGTVLCAVVASALCSGCAFGHREVALNYTSPDDSACNAENEQTIYIAPIEDVCPNADVTLFAKGREIGDIRNGFYMKTASVVSKTHDLGAWVTDALAKELACRGYQVLPVTSLPPECSCGLSGSLSECYSTMKFFGGQTCTLKATVSIHKDGAPVSHKEYVGLFEGGLALCTADEYEKIFQGAMTSLASQVIADIGGQVAP